MNTKKNSVAALAVIAAFGFCHQSAAQEVVYESSFTDPADADGWIAAGNWTLYPEQGGRYCGAASNQADYVEAPSIQRLFAHEAGAGGYQLTLVSYGTKDDNTDEAANPTIGAFVSLLSDDADLQFFCYQNRSTQGECFIQNSLRNEYGESVVFESTSFSIGKMDLGRPTSFEFEVQKAADNSATLSLRVTAFGRTHSGVLNASLPSQWSSSSDAFLGVFGHQSGSGDLSGGLCVNSLSYQEQ